MSDFYPPQISDIEKPTIIVWFFYKKLVGMIGFEPMDPHDKIVWALNDIIHKAMYDINTCSNWRHILGAVMTFNDIEMAQINRCMEFFMEKRRPPEFVRDEIDLRYRIWGLNVIIYEVRHIDYRAFESPIAKITLNRAECCWKLFWKNPSDEWVTDIKNPIQSFSDVIKIVENDVRGCFFR